MSVIFQSTSYSQSQASPKKRHLCASSAVKKVCRHTQFTYMIQRILTEVSSTLMLLVKNTNIHIESRRLSIILVLLQWSAGMSLKRPASVSTVVCGSKIHMYGQHLYLLLDYPSAKLLKTRWMSLRVIFYVIFSLQCLCPLLFNGFSFLISYHLLTIFICSSSG